MLYFTNTGIVSVRLKSVIFSFPENDMISITINKNTACKYHKLYATKTIISGNNLLHPERKNQFCSFHKAKRNFKLPKRLKTEFRN